MKKIFLALITISFVCVSCSQTSEVKKNTITKDSLQTEIDKLSYAIGLNIGKRLKTDSMNIDADVFSKGVADGISEQNVLMTDEEVKDVILAFQKKKVDEKRVEANENKKIGDEFLAGKKNEEGVIALESGLLYKVIQQGSGNTPGGQDTVKVNYRGMTVDGKEFDSSYARNKPATFKVNRVVKGWTEALQLMKEGDKWELYIPSDLAYGPRGNRNIPPNSALIFEIELLNIEPKKDNDTGKKDKDAEKESASLK
ncbi:MAG: FKBP-type peptidyl-prolyl cis-trans isomerase [Proteobacteria bacterium]|nr:FKBP-type peptidyl-prolyl cis-trans isomerase [Pseudomonadota bacterium]